MTINELEVTELFSNGGFTAYELEGAVLRDAKKFSNVLFSQWCSEKLREWISKTNSEDVLRNIYEYSFMFGACTAFECHNVGDDPFDDVKGLAAIARPRLFSQLITPNEDLRNWINKSECIDVIYDLYEKSFTYGVYYIMNVINDGGYRFERNG